MKEIKYCKLNAFSSGNSLGNPAAYLLLGNERLSEENMLKIAREHKGFVSEVIYVTSRKDNYFLEYYSSECEVAFCGHGTIACMYDLIKNDPDLIGKEEIEIITNKKGKLIVYNNIKDEDAVYITAPDPNWIDCKINIPLLAKALITDTVSILNDNPIELIDAGLRTLVVPIADYSLEINILPDRKVLEDYCMENGIDIILIFSTETSSAEYSFHTRVFAPKYGYLEDPATGSGNSAFGYYLLKNKMWDGDCISIEQGSKDMIYNEIKLKKMNDKVIFGGLARKTIEGKYFLQ